MKLIDLWICGRSRGAKNPNVIDKCDFLVVQRCGNACLRRKQSKPCKNHQTEGGTYPSRPSRSRWSQKFGDLFVFGGGTRRYLRFRNFECHISARSVHIRSETDDRQVGLAYIDPRGSNGARIFEICSYLVGVFVQNTIWPKSPPLPGQRESGGNGLTSLKLIQKF